MTKQELLNALDHLKRTALDGVQNSGAWKGIRQEQVNQSSDKLRKFIEDNHQEEKDRETNG